MDGPRPCSCECESGWDSSRVNYCGLYLPPFLSLTSLFLRTDRPCSLPGHPHNHSSNDSFFQPVGTLLLQGRRAKADHCQETRKYADGSSILARRHALCNLGAGSDSVHGRTHSCRSCGVGRLAFVRSRHPTRRNCLWESVRFNLISSLRSRGNSSSTCGS